MKLVPVMVTAVPRMPLAGEKEAMSGTSMKACELVTVPEGLVTEIGPTVAPLGTVAVIWVSETTVNVADVPLKATSVAPVYWAPLMVTLVPTGPLVGVKEEIRSSASAGVDILATNVSVLPAFAAWNALTVGKSVDAVEPSSVTQWVTAVLSESSNQLTHRPDRRARKLKVSCSGRTFAAAAESSNRSPSGAQSGRHGYSPLTTLHRRRLVLSDGFDNGT